MMNKLFKWADERTPVGIEGKKEIGWAACGLGISFLYSLTYYFSLWSYIDNLYGVSSVTGKRVLLAGSYMPDFAAFAPSRMKPFVITALIFLTLAVYHYIYHYQESKSIYTMRRLPDRWELHRRCLTFPITVAVICLVSAVLLTGIYLWSYNLSVPKARLRPGQLEILLETLFGGAK